LIPAFEPLAGSIVHIARIGMTLTLFFIGLSLTRAALKSVGYKAIVQGIALWVAVSGVSLMVIRETIVSHP